MTREQYREHSDYLKVIKNSDDTEDPHLLDIICECCPDYIDIILDSLEQLIPVNKEGIIIYLPISICRKTFDSHLETIEFIKEIGRTNYLFLYSYLNGVITYTTFDIYENILGLSNLVREKIRDKSIDSLLD